MYQDSSIWPMRGKNYRKKKLRAARHRVFEGAFDVFNVGIMEWQEAEYGDHWVRWKIETTPCSPYWTDEEMEAYKEFRIKIGVDSPGHEPTWMRVYRRGVIEVIDVNKEIWAVMEFA
eukprot:Phypoly_transcript_23191.p2 GENE.Phypoly_transcript_23191~~Phypoly_transcript_23191.p2  ORF type:complete len:117 (+),score=13.26 Phypoly_transcript_23191:231-581(+)